jgi:hypothetical protein
MYTASYTLILYNFHFFALMLSLPVLIDCMYHIYLLPVALLPVIYRHLVTTLLFIVFLNRPASASAYSLALDSLPFIGNLILPSSVNPLSPHYSMIFGRLCYRAATLLPVGRPPGGSRRPSRPSGPSVRPSLSVWLRAPNRLGDFSPELWSWR